MGPQESDRLLSCRSSFSEPLCSAKNLLQILKLPSRPKTIQFVVKKGKKNAKEKNGQNPNIGHPRSYSLSELIKRVFGLDVLKCDRCGNRMRILCTIKPPDVIKKILDCLGLPSRPPPVSPRHWIAASILGKHLRHTSGASRLEMERSVKFTVT
jgi:hypothetical protein